MIIPLKSCPSQLQLHSILHSTFHHNLKNSKHSIYHQQAQSQQSTNETIICVEDWHCRGSNENQISMHQLKKLIAVLNIAQKQKIVFVNRLIENYCNYIH